jgi:purine-nucleoside/S-methyl-5'-thioadenosine phosphorylase / adenosine deaminase
VSGRPDPLAAGFDPGVTGLFTTRAGGVSLGAWSSFDLSLRVGDDVDNVRANRELLVRLLGSDPLHFSEQVHGRGVAVVDTESVGSPQWTLTGAPGTDALVTTLPGVPLVVLGADCMPVLFADLAAGVIAAAHAGRPGLAAGILQQTLATMVTLGADPGRTTVVIGPAACGRCYEVPEGMRDDVAAVVPGSSATTRQGTASLDLAAGAEALLVRAGVESIRRLEICTIEDDRMFSHRRSAGRPTGRHAGVVMLDP